MKNEKIKKYEEKIKELKEKLKEIEQKIKNKDGKFSKLYPQKIGIEFDIDILNERINLEIEKDLYKKTKNIFHKENIEYLKNLIKSLQEKRKISVRREREFWNKL